MQYVKVALSLSVSDAPGDSAIFECFDGKLKIHHDTVMPHSPVAYANKNLDGMQYSS